MKKLITLTLFMFLTSATFAQFYIRGNVGYNFVAGAQRIGTDEIEQNDNGYSRTEKGVYGSYGSGISIQAAVGGSISGALGYDVAFGYLVGKKYSEMYSYTTNGTLQSSNENEAYSRSFQFAPSLSFTAGTGHVQPYTRFGPVVAVTSMNVKTTDYNIYYGYEIVDEYKMKANLSIGFTCALGVSYELSDKLHLFSEANFISLTYAPKERELTGYTVDGEDRMDDVEPSMRKVKYKDKITYTGEDWSPIQPREKFTMGSIGIQVGVKFVLN